MNNEKMNQQRNIPFGSFNKHMADTTPLLMCLGVGLPLASAPFLLRVAWRRWAAALAPGPSWEILSSKHIAWLLTTTVVVARLVSPMSFPRKASESPSQPAAPAIASANVLNKL